MAKFVLEQDLQALRTLIMNETLINEGSYSRVYQHGLETFKSYFECFEFLNKRVCTVASSGDAPLNAIYKGATDIVAFDHNPFSGHFLYLKLAACLTLDFDEYSQFFNGKNSMGDNYYANYFSKSLYDTFKNNLAADSRVFWDEFYLLFEKINAAPFLLIQGNPRALSSVQKVNYFSSEEGYKILQSKAVNAKLDFITSDIYALSQKLEGSFDLMFLSNIYTHLVKYFQTGDGKKFQSFIINDLGKSLNDEGAIVAAYTYFWLRSNEVNWQLQRHILELANDKMEIISFEPYFDSRNITGHEAAGRDRMVKKLMKTYPSYKDAIAVYHKTA